MWISFFERGRQLVSSPSEALIVDKALLYIYANADKQKLSEFVRSENVCTIEDAEQFLLPNVSSE